MSTDWQTLRNRLIHETGDIPGNHLEDELIARYRDNPDTVERAVDKIIAGYKAGKIRSAWGALKAEIARAFNPDNNPTHDHGSTKTKAVQRAEVWMRNAGLHFDRQSEIEDELYGERGTLRDYPDTRQHMVSLWLELAPIGAQIQHEAEERGRRYAEQRANIDLTPKPATGNLTTDELKALAARKSMPVTTLLEDT